MIGRTLGHYVILERLGAGGMGEVCRAGDEKLRREVALKVLPGAETADPEARCPAAARDAYGLGAQPTEHLHHPRGG